MYVVSHEDMIHLVNTIILKAASVGFVGGIVLTVFSIWFFKRR